MKAFWRYVTAGVGFAVLVTLVLLATGWGTAVASSLSNVFITNTSANPVPVTPTGTVPVHEQGTPNVKVTNTTPLPVQETNTDAQGNIKVHEQGTADVNVTDFPNTQTVNGSVNVGNFPNAPTTKVISVNGIIMTPGFTADVLGPVDLSAYREVTLYLVFEGGGVAVPHCEVTTSDGSQNYTIDDFSGTTSSPDFLVKTYDPAPPNIFMSCTDSSNTFGITGNFMLAGRTG
jgi:hypothetical protein